MNFALPAAIIFLLLLPGFAFRSRLQLAEGTKVDYSPFGHVVATSLLCAAAIHSVLLAGTQWVLGISFRYDILFRLLTNSVSASDVGVISRDIGLVAIYFVVALAGAIALSATLQIVVSKSGLDRSYSKLAPIFRFKKAPWHYVLSGRDLRKQDRPDLIQIAAVASVGGAAYLYQGVLESYFFDDSGQLDRLVLSRASRRLLANDSTFDVDDNGTRGRRAKFKSRGEPKYVKSKFYPILGDYFVLHYDEVVTLNIRYLKFDEADRQDSLNA